MGRHWRRRGPRVLIRRHDALAALDPHEFEQVVADYYRGQGYRVEHCGGRGRFDGGIDLKLYRDGEYVVVQCKRENAYQVTHNVGHELLGVLLTEKADRAIVVNTGEFTRHAWESAGKEARLELIDGARLREMLPAYAVPAPKREAERADDLDRYILSTPVPNLEAVREPMVPRQGGRAAARPTRSRPSVLDVRGRQGSSRRRGQKSEGARVIMAFAILAGILAWQCSRDPVEPGMSARPNSLPADRSTAPASSRVAPVSSMEAGVSASSEQPVERTSGAQPRVARSPEESRRRAEQSMQVLAPHTPEFVPLPASRPLNGDERP